MFETLDPQHAVKVALAERQMSQAELARRVGTHASTLSRVLGESQMIDARSLWPKIFDELGLEIIIRPKSQ